MQSKTGKLNIIITLLVSVFFLTSCEKEEAIEADEFSVENVQQTAEIDVTSDAVSSIIEEAYIQDGKDVGKSTDTFLPECMTKTVEFDGNARIVTLNFEGDCEMHNGNILSGIITMIYVRDPLALTRTITYSFSDFYFNYKNIEGGGSILREKSNTNGNPQSTKNQDINVTWPDGKTAHRIGVKVREWIEGFGSGTWGDNVYAITGNWTTEFPNGNVNSGIITTPLRRELACRFIVSGVIALSHNEAAGTLDFGDGSCDNKAIFTGSNGVEHEVILR
ncbi:MAG TPA: hypothetical protein EYG92_11930 [Lutibacter sp.]|nr:hypothetical protein [Lutibacter sp.]